MSKKDIDLTEIAKQAMNTNKAPEVTNVPEQEVLTQMTEFEKNKVLMDALEEDPSLAEVTTEIFHTEVKAGPPGNKENVLRSQKGLPALYPDGRQWYKPGNEPEGWVRGTVELPDGRILTPLQAFYVVITYGTRRNAQNSLEPITDGDLLQLFVQYYDEALTNANEAITKYIEKKKEEAAEEAVNKQAVEADLALEPKEEVHPSLIEAEQNEEDLQQLITEQNTRGPVLPTPPKQNIIETEEGDTVIASPHQGAGIVIEQKKSPVVGELSEEKKEEIEIYMEEMESEFNDPDAVAIRKKMAEVNPLVATAEEVAEIHGAAAVLEINNHHAKLSGREDAQIDTGEALEALVEEGSESRESTKERLEKFRTAIISIDKVNAHNLDFTDEERAKLEHVDKIKVAEVEVVDIHKLRRRKAKSGAVDTLLSRRGNTSRTFNMVLPASGYVATMTGCSLHELMNLINDTNDPVNSYLLKWSIIHSKLVTTSLGDITDFDYFMKHTADSDMNAFVYAIMVSSLPTNDTITLTCSNDKCKLPDGKYRDYEFPYTVRSLLRVEDFSDELITEISRISAASTTKESAIAAHNESMVMKSTGIRLPDTGDVIEIQVPSAYDFLERTLKTITNNDEIKPEYSRASVTASRVNAVLAFTDDDSDPIEITNPIEIVKYIYSLPPRDIIVLENLITKYTSNNTFSFGLVDITCPHCQNHTEVLDIEVSELLFIRTAKVTATIVE